MTELLREYSLSAGFSPALREESRRVAGIDPLAREGRLDLRGLTVLAIDPADARDHDDAISLETLPDGLRRLGVHIADVAEYVQEGSLLDREAFRRGNSTYFYLDTVPMLPPLLSGQLCSLREEEDSPALSVLMDFGPRGEIHQVSFCESVVSIARCLSYQEAEALLDTEDPGEPSASLREMLTLAETLRARRKEEGALQFELSEILPLDKGDGVESFQPAPVLRSHGIVEEFMLAANHEVGYLLRERGLPRILRIHEPPDPEKVEELRFHVRKAGIAWQPARPVRSKNYQELAAKLSGRVDRERQLMRMLRSMKKACYSDRDLGHFGLGWRDYLHFTSPIRRYSDLLVHRELKALISAEGVALGGRERRLARDGGPSLRASPPGKDRRDYSYLFTGERRRRRRALSEVTHAINECELNSLQAEREGLRLEMALWARRHLGESFTAEVLSIFPTGLLLRLEERGVEGFMPAQFLGREYFAYDEEREELRGEHSGRRFQADQRLSVRIIGANLFSRRIQFSLEDPVVS